MKKVFLGGTCNGSTWRDILIEKLTIEYFNPVVIGEWTEESLKEEIRQRETCTINLYVLTPKMIGFTSIVEIMQDIYTRPNKTVVCFLGPWQNAHMNKSINFLIKIVEEQIPGRVFYDLSSLASHLNS